MDPGNFLIFEGAVADHAKTSASGAVRFRMERPAPRATRIQVQMDRPDPAVVNQLVTGTMVQVVGGLELCQWQDASGQPREIIRICADQIIILPQRGATRCGTYSDPAETHLAGG